MSMQMFIIELKTYIISRPFCWYLHFAVYSYLLFLSFIIPSFSIEFIHLVIYSSTIFIEYILYASADSPQMDNYC